MKPNFRIIDSVVLPVNNLGSEILIFETFEYRVEQFERPHLVDLPVPR